MSFPVNNESDSYLPVYDNIPEEWDEARQILVEFLRRISNGINAREIGSFINEETLTGIQFIPNFVNSQDFRSISRIVIPFGTLPNSGTKSVPHTITVDSNFSLLNMYLSATDPVNLVGFSLQYWSKAAADIKLSYSSSNIIVTTSSDYSAYTISYVVFEFCQEP